MSETLRAAIEGGLSIHEAAAVAGICRSSAYLAARDLGLVSSRGRGHAVPEASRRQVLALIERGALSLAAIATSVGISKPSVIRIRDAAAVRGAKCERGEFRATRKAYTCPGCGHRIRVMPCVACAALEASCPHAE